MEASAIAHPTTRRIGGAGPPRFLRLRSDEQLVELFRAGDDAAFGAIHDRHRQRLFAYTRQMLGGSRQDAEDALQDVFLRAYRALRADQRPVSLRAWLYRVAHNRCIDELRRPIPPPAEVFELSRRPLRDPIVEAERREDLRQLVEDVRHLPPQQRSALLMREIEGLSYAELAGALDVTIPAVKSLLVRARIGLVEASEARDTACSEIRASLALAHGRGVRATALTRRHLRQCSACREYRQGLRAVRARFAALTPAPLLGSVAALLGGGGAGTSAVVGGGLAGVTSATAVTKTAVVVCAVAVTAGGATEVRQRIASPAPSAAAALPPSQADRFGGGAPSGVRQVAPLRLPAVYMPNGERSPWATAHAGRTRSTRQPHPAAAMVPAEGPGLETISPHAPTERLSFPPPPGGAVGPTEDAPPAVDEPASAPEAQRPEAVADPRVLPGDPGSSTDSRTQPTAPSSVPEARETPSPSTVGPPTTKAAAQPGGTGAPPGGAAAPTR